MTYWVSAWATRRGSPITQPRKSPFPVDDQALCTHRTQPRVAGTFWDAWMFKSGVEYPGAGGLITETDTRVTKDVVKGVREDPVEVL